MKSVYNNRDCYLILFSQESSFMYCIVLFHSHNIAKGCHYCTSEEEEIKREFILLSKWQGQKLIS